MKVLFIHKTCGRGGVTTGIRKKYIGLKSLGIESDFLFLHDTGGKDTFSDTGMRLFQASDNEAIGNIIASNEYTHISSIDCPEVSNVLSTLSGKTKIICEVRTPSPEEGSYLREGGLPRNVLHIVTPSAAFSRIVKRELHKEFSHVPISVIPNPVEERFFTSAGNSDYSIPLLYVGWVGRLGSMKNIEELFSIIRRFSELGSGVRFMIVGSRPASSRSHTGLEISHIDGKLDIIWLPFVRHQMIHEFYRFLRESGGCLLSTSKGETHSNVIVESMASRCPVVASDIEVFREILEGGRYGALYKAGDIAGGVAAIERVLNDSGYRRAITEQAYKQAREHFTMDKAFRRWKELFESL